MKMKSCLLLVLAMCSSAACFRLNPKYDTIRYAVELSHNLEVPTEFYGLLLAADGTPIPAGRLALNHVWANWPDFKWSGPPYDREITVEVITDEDGRFSYFSKSGGTVNLTQPKLIFFVDGHWQVQDHEASNSMSAFYVDEGIGDMRFRPTFENPATLRLKVVDDPNESYIYDTFNRHDGPVPNFYQHISEPWPPPGVIPAAAVASGVD